ncbi:MAG: fibronectin type III domain-containing protein [Syntrophomonas sp.]
MIKNSRTMRSAKLGILCILTLLISLLAPFYATAVSIPFNLTVPIGGESLTVGNQMDIQWQPVSQYAGLHCNLDYSTNGGATWTPISTGIDFSSGQFNWTIPNTPTANALIRISLDVPVPLVGGTIHVEQKSGVFSIIPGNPDKPAAPTNLTATAISGTQVNLSWKDNSSNETKFTIIRKSTGANEVIASLAANVTSYLDKNLSPNTSYTYRVIAMNDAGDSLSGEATAKTKSDSYTDDSPPAAPSNLSATAISSSQINLSWQANTGAMGFVIKRKSAGDYEDVADLLPNVTSYQDKNLSPNTSYTYIVMAWNNCGKVNSNETTAKTSSGTSGPTAPSNLSASASSSSQITLTWKDNSSNELGFIIQRKSTGSFETVGTVLANITAYQDKNLSPDTSYTYVVIAFTNLGTTTSNEATAQTSKAGQTNVTLSTPVNLSASANSSSQISLTWEDKSSTESGYKIERKSSGSFEQIGDVGVNIVSYVDSNLAADTTYTYRVKAYDSASSSSYSNEASAKTSSSSTLPNNSTGSNQMRFYIGNTNYYVNNQLKSMDAAPQIYESRTVLPIGYVVEPMGAAIDWNQAAQKVTIKLNGKQIELTIGNSYAQVNGVSKPIDANNSNVKPVMLPPGRTMMPLSFILTELGCGVNWNETTQEVKITY